MIERAKPTLASISFVRLPHNERLLALPEHRDTPQFYSGMREALGETKSAYAAALHGLEARGGMCPESLFHTVSGCPTRAKRLLTSSKCLEDLMALGLIVHADKAEIPSGWISVHPTAPIESLETPAARARLIAEDVLLKGFQRWLRNLGLASYNKIELRSSDASDLPNFANFQWDVVGPSYILPLKNLAESGQKMLPGFIVADVILGIDELSEVAIEYFIRKCALIQGMNKHRPFLPFLIAERFSPAALHRGRSSGAIFATPENLFGDDVARTLAELIITLDKAARAIVADPETLHRLFTNLARIEGSALNLRGALFEMLIAYAVSRHEGGEPFVGHLLRAPDGEPADVDILLVKGKEMVGAYELKGIAPHKTVTLAEVKRWRERTVPAVLRYVNERPELSKAVRKFEYWTSGSFEPDALAYLQQQSSHRAPIYYKEGNEVRAYLQQLNERRLVEVFDEHYYRHPLALP